MKVKFVNGVVKECTAPTEQKLFKKNEAGETVAAGWLLMLFLTDEMTSSELDSIIEGDNCSTLEFLSKNERGEDISLFTLEGYDNVTSSIIRHSDGASTTRTEIHLSKEG